MINPVFVLYLVFMVWSVAALVAGLACVVMAATWLIYRVVLGIDMIKKVKK